MGSLSGSPVFNIIETVIFDLGGVLFEWSAPTTVPISPKTFRRVLNSPTWFEYEKGQLTEDECYALVARDLGLTFDHVAHSFHAIRETLRIRPDVLDLIRELKSGHKVYAMSNMAAPNWEFICQKYPECDVFDRVFVSAAVGERKPNLGFYRHVLQQTDADPRRTVFIDDQLQNVFTARSFGMEGILYDNFPNLQRALRNACENPIERAWAFLRLDAPKGISYTDAGHTIKDNFAPLLILEATGDPSLVEYTCSDGPWRFFRGESSFTPTLPPDVDTTSLGYTIVPHTVPEATKHRVMDEILANRNRDGIVQIYFGSTRPRIDAATCVNVLTLFYAYGRGEELKETFDWVQAVLETRAYVDGTYYYTTAESFLYFLSRLFHISPEVRKRLVSVYAECCRERIGQPGDALALAMRVICCAELGLDVSLDAERLLKLQDLDGGWQDGWFYRYPVVGLVVGNRSFTTALAINALKLAFGMQKRTNGHVQGAPVEAS